MSKRILTLIVMVFFVAVLIASAISLVDAAEEPICSVYFTGVGCSHCAKVDPFLFGSKLPETGTDFVVIEYEIFQEQENPNVMTEYTNSFSMSPGVPQILFGKDTYLRGDSTIINGLDGTLSSLENGNTCPLPDGNTVSLNDISISSLEGTPKIWVGDRILIKTKIDAEKMNDSTLRDVLFGDYPDLSSCSAVSECIAPEPVQYSGGEITFEKAAKIGDGWLLQWGREGVKKEGLQDIGFLITVTFLVIISIGVYIKETSVRKKKLVKKKRHKEGKKKK